MTATDPTPQPATHASGPLAGQPVTPTAQVSAENGGDIVTDTPERPTDAELDDGQELDISLPSMRRPGRRMLLVPESVGRVLDAVREFRAVWVARQQDPPGTRPHEWHEVCVELAAAVDALGEPTPDDQRRCPVAHPAHGQCELYQGHRPDDDPDRRHRTGALLWLTDAEIQACGLPPLASYAGPADLQSGPANASGPAGGPGWDRDTIDAIIAGWDLRGVSDGSQETLRALLADRDRLSIDAEQAQDRIALAESAVGEAEREVDRLEEELVGARSECDRLRGERNDLRHQASAFEAMLATTRADREALFGTHEWAVAEHERELATARRDAAADALDEAADRAEKLRWPAVKIPQLREWAGDHRAVAHVQRPAPGSPELAGGEEPDHD
jgi:hypothetical protein